MSTTVVLADDHAMVRDSLTSYLASTPDVRVVAAVGTAEEAVEEAVRHNPDVVLLDIDMPGLAAFEAARRIRGRCPKTRVVMLSAFFHDHYIEQALAAGASGYLTKTEPVESIVRAIRDAAAGIACFSPQVRARLVLGDNGVSMAETKVGPGSRFALQTRASQLSGRELEVLRYLARGLANKEIAATMNLACRTVDHHVARIMRKLNIHARVGLARFAVREGLAEP
jgi:DNA-binding NarL/FixJ family response regulator